MLTDLEIRNYSPIIKYYKERIEDGKGSKTLNILNLAIVLQNKGDYKESNKLLYSVKNNSSFVSNFLALTINDNIRDYKLEPFEKEFLDYSIAMNHFMLGENKQAYRVSSNISYFKGLLAEKRGDYKGALKSYKDSSKSIAYRDFDIWSVAKEAKVKTKVRIPKIYKNFKNSGEHKKMTEVLVFINNGWSAIKTPHKYNGDIPVYTSRVTINDYFTVKVNRLNKGKSYSIYDLDKLAKQDPQKTFKKYRNRAFTKFFTTEAAMLPVNALSGAGGIFLRGFVHSRDKADFRTWELAPKDIQVVRFYVSEGKNNIVVKGLDGRVAGEFTIDAKAGETKVLLVSELSQI